MVFLKHGEQAKGRSWVNEKLGRRGTSRKMGEEEKKV